MFFCNSLVILPETITWLTIRQMLYYLTVTSRNRFAQFLVSLDLFLALQVISSIHLVHKGLWIGAISVCQWTIFERGNVVLEVSNNHEAVGRGQTLLELWVDENLYICDDKHRDVRRHCPVLFELLRMFRFPPPCSCKPLCAALQFIY